MGQFFLRAEKYLDQLDLDSVGHFVEIGTSRNGDDGSTKIISTWAARYQKQLYTVDIDPININFVNQIAITNVKTWLGSGEDFFHQCIDIQPISFLYLDNFDWDWHPENSEQFVLDQQARYDQLGLTMNNLNSQRAHLAQMIAALPSMAERSVVILDDTWYNKYWGHYSGKGGAVVPYLLNHGFCILETEEYPEYGTIMGRNIL